MSIPLDAIQPGDLDGLSGLHFHTLCEQDFPPLERTIAVFERNFGGLLKGMKWMNFGGGHHVTRPGYQVQDLIRTLKDFAQRYGVQAYIEPGEAIAWKAGVLVAEVLDTMENGMPKPVPCTGMPVDADTIDTPGAARSRSSIWS